MERARDLAIYDGTYMCGLPIIETKPLHFLLLRQNIFSFSEFSVLQDILRCLPQTEPFYHLDKNENAQRLLVATAKDSRRWFFA